MLCHVGRERAQRGEDLLVIGIARAQLEAVFLGDQQRNFEDIDGIEPESFALQRCVGGQGIELNVFEIQFADHECGELFFQVVHRSCTTGGALRGLRPEPPTIFLPEAPALSSPACEGGRLS